MPALIRRLLNGNITNRWTGATGSDFRIKRDPAKLLGSAVARSTPPFASYDIEKLIDSPQGEYDELN